MQAGRDGRIDFYRGLALIFIFWDHIPGNILGSVSLRNFGLSDAAEIFVFLAGYGAALAYGGVMARDGYPAAGVRVLKRAWVLYVAHIFLMIVLMGVVFATNARVENRNFVQEMQLGYFIVNTEQALIDALILRFKPNLTDPLPLYILLLLLLAAILPLLARRRALVLAASALLYGLTLVFDWNLPGHPGEGWFFNPLAWQFLFLLGSALAMERKAGRRMRIPHWLLTASIAYLAMSALLVLSWNWPALHDALVPQGLRDLLYPISKTNLGPLRLLHFLALFVCAVALLPGGAWLDHPLSAQIRRIGRCSLEVFCLGVILAPLADAANMMTGNRLLVQLLTGLTGVAVMFALAWMIEWSRGLRSRPQPKPAPSVISPAE